MPVGLRVGHVLMYWWDANQTVCAYRTNASVGGKSESLLMMHLRRAGLTVTPFSRQETAHSKIAR
jgi:hypothetical protein